MDAARGPSVSHTSTYDHRQGGEHIEVTGWYAGRRYPALTKECQWLLTLPLLFSNASESIKIGAYTELLEINYILGGKLVTKDISLASSPRNAFPTVRRSALATASLVCRANCAKHFWSAFPITFIGAPR